jgi:APA family basic amino acid/polyamine antiporter
LLSLGGDGSTYLFAAILIVLLASLNLRGISEAADADFVIVVFKVSALAVFIVWALVAGVHLSSNLTQPPESGVSGIFSASVIAMFAYAGFQSIATMVPNIKGGGRTAARAIVVAVAISLVLYVLVTLALLALVPVGQFGFRADPLSFALSSAGAPTWLFLLIGLAALAATASATLAMIIASSQLLLQLSGDGLLPGILGRRKGGHPSALGALVMTIVFGTLFMFLGNIYVIAAVSNFGVLFSYMLSGFALLKIRRMRRHPERHPDALREAGVPDTGIVEMPWFPYLPIIGIGFLIAFFFAFPSLALSIGLGIVLVSILAYYVLREDRDEPVIKIRFFR